MVDKVDDNHNEVLRGASELDSVLYKYNLRTINAESEALAEQLVTNQQNLLSCLSNINKSLLEIKGLLKAIAE
jgi:hypothetical protein